MANTRSKQTYYAARLLTTQWAQPGDGVHVVYPACSDITDPAGRPLVTAYAVRRPDRRLALILINKDPIRSWDTRIELRSSGAPEPTKGGADVYQVSPATYVWHPGGEHGFPRPDLPPAHTTLDSLATAIRLPPFSLTVARTTPLP